MSLNHSNQRHNIDLSIGDARVPEDCLHDRHPILRIAILNRETPKSILITGKPELLISRI